MCRKNVKKLKQKESLEQFYKWKEDRLVWDLMQSIPTKDLYADYELFVTHLYKVQPYTKKTFMTTLNRTFKTENQLNKIKYIYKNERIVKGLQVTNSLIQD